MTGTRELLIYSRPGCHLCQELIDQVRAEALTGVFIRVVNVDADPVTRDQYGDEVPVVLLQGAEVCRHRLDRAALRAAIDELL